MRARSGKDEIPKLSVSGQEIQNCVFVKKQQQQAERQEREEEHDANEGWKRRCGQLQTDYAIARQGGSTITSQPACISLLQNWGGKKRL